MVKIILIKGVIEMNIADRTVEFFETYGNGMYIVTDMATQNQDVISECRNLAALEEYRNSISSTKNLRVYQISKRSGYADFQYYLEGN